MNFGLNYGKKREKLLRSQLEKIDKINWKQKLSRMPQIHIDQKEIQKNRDQIEPQIKKFLYEKISPGYLSDHRFSQKKG